MVITPVFEIVTTPPPVASEVAPVESKVETDVSPVTSSLPLKLTSLSTARYPEVYIPKSSYNLLRIVFVEISSPTPRHPLASNIILYPVPPVF